jgi:hypothetical protein
VEHRQGAANNSFGQQVNPVLADTHLRVLVRPEGRDHLVGESPTRAMVGWPGSWQAVWLGNWLDRSPATKAALGGRANWRAVMRMKSEQASKGKLWTPTQPKRGEGSTVWGSSRRMHLDRSAGVVGTARQDRGSRKRGRPVLDGGSGLNDAEWHRSVRESDRVIVLLKAVMPVEGRTLTSGVFSKQTRWGDWR